MGVSLPVLRRPETRGFRPCQGPEKAGAIADAGPGQEPGYWPGTQLAGRFSRNADTPSNPSAERK